VRPRRSAVTAGRPNRTATIALYLVTATVIVRTLVENRDPSLLPWYLVLAAVFVILHTLVWWRRGLPHWSLHLIFAVQCLVLTGMLALKPDMEYITTFFVPLSYQAAVRFTGRARWGWPLIFALFTLAPLMVWLGPLRGLAFALLNTAGVFVLPAFAAATEDIERAHAESEAMIKELEGTRARLQASIDQVDELAAMEERARLARELHDSVTQTMFSIMLSARSAQMLQEGDRARLRQQLLDLQQLTQNALEQMRSLIAELRPAPPEPDSSN
jgi:signal transduction histidine kinase